MSKISVIVPVYNVQAYLSRCVGSVLHQSFQDFELILVDDGSPDNCPRLCDEYAGRDLRVHVIHRENGGLSAARNSGIQWVLENSQSAYAMFLDSDDWIHQECLQRLYTALIQEHADLCLCEFKRVRETEEDPVLSEPSPEVLDPESAYVKYYGLCMTACCKLISRKALETLHFPEGKLHEDCFVTHKLLFAAERVAVLRDPLYNYYFNPQSITKKKWTPKRLEELEAHDVRLDFLRQHGYEKAAAREQQILITTIYEHVEVLAYLKNPQNKPWLKQLRSRLRRELRQGKNLVPLDAETIWFYLMAYPMCPLWRMGKKAQSLWHRLHRED